MYPDGWIKVAVTDWMDDSAERFGTSSGKMTSLEWLRVEKDRIAKVAPFSRPFIRIHPKYFDKDSHGRRRHKQIALYRFINPAELPEKVGGGTRIAFTSVRRERYAANEPDALTTVCAVS